MAPVVTLVTARVAAADDLPDGDYREIYDELRSKCSLRAFADFIGSQYSFAWWSKYERGEAPLTRQARAELRRIVGLPALPPTVGEAVAPVDPDATVYRIGDQTPDRLILLGGDCHEPLTLRVNGACEIVTGNLAAGDAAANAPQRPCNPRYIARSAKRHVAISPDRFDRLSALKAEAGLTWDELVDWVLELCGG